MSESLEPSSSPLLSVEDLNISIQQDRNLINAVDGVNLQIRKGETLGLVGESGCGKSLTSRAIIQLNPKECKTTGKIMYKSTKGNTDILKLKPRSKKIREFRGGVISMIFQEPMTALSPLYTIGNQIMETILIHITKNKKEAKGIAIDMLQKVGISNPERRFGQYPHEFSGGMRQRVMIAMALACEPELLIADEPTTALDVTIQAQVLELMKYLQNEFGMAILLVTHDLGVIAEVCDEVAVMYLGKIVEQAPVKEIFNNPKHPYTKGLIKSMPRLGGNKNKRLESIEGTVPLAINMQNQCGFYDRCPQRMEGLCNIQSVPEYEVNKEHTVRCFLYDNEHKEDQNYGTDSRG